MSLCMQDPSLLLPRQHLPTFSLHCLDRATAPAIVAVPELKGIPICPMTCFTTAKLASRRDDGGRCGHLCRNRQSERTEQTSFSLTPLPRARNRTCHITEDSLSYQKTAQRSFPRKARAIPASACGCDSWLSISLLRELLARRKHLVDG